MLLACFHSSCFLIGDFNQPIRSTTLVKKKKKTNVHIFYKTDICHLRIKKEKKKKITGMKKITLSPISVLSKKRNLIHQMVNMYQNVIRLRTNKVIFSLSQKRESKQIEIKSNSFFSLTTELSVFVENWICNPSFFF